ncbi:beta-ketoacyl-ACP synthase [Nitrosomonas sp. JL21]|nr:beta-ketoacyl-[acyl-carrier-protein] synthase family protein [Nitrosomonas sp.]MXS76368.1 beta-ketoacyl-ACP synthase [Nitrosomonas sp. JL21]
MRSPAFLAMPAFTATSSLGNGLASLRSSLVAQHTGLVPCQFESVDLETYIGITNIPEDDVFLPAELQALDCRNNRLAFLGLQQDGFIDAVGKAKCHFDNTRIGVFLGTSTSGMLQTEKGYRELDPQTGALPSWVNYRFAQNTGSAAHFVRLALGLGGPAAVVSTACSSSAKVFAMAQRMLLLGAIDAAIVGGVDSLCLTTLYGFHSLQLLSRNPCKPFDTGRDGISIGEAAVFALLTRDDAHTPSGSLLIKGVGESSDAYHMSSPHPEGLGARQAMQSALQQARLGTPGIDYIHLHGTATKNNDAIESIAVSAIFGEQSPASSTKGATGHCLGAAGALNVVIGALALQQQTAWGSPGTEKLDATLSPIHYLTQNAARPMRHVLSNSFGFGGSNCSVVLGLKD